MSKISVYIVEDEPHAVEILQDMLQDKHQYQLLGAANNVEEAFHTIAKTKPSVVLLDIHLGGQTGFDLLKRLYLNDGYMPDIIFTTSHDEYAIEAFKIHAFDFLLKPVDALELAKTLNRYSSQKSRQEQLRRFEELLLKVSSPKRLIAIPTLTGIKNLKTEDIFYVELVNSNSLNNIVLHADVVKKEVLPAYVTLKDMGDWLPEDTFFQINRTTIVNLGYLDSIEIKPRHCIMKKDNMQDVLPISRSRLKAYKERFLA